MKNNNLPYSKKIAKYSIEELEALTTNQQLAILIKLNIINQNKINRIVNNLVFFFWLSILSLIIFIIFILEFLQ